jgi:hypothetical protein
VAVVVQTNIALALVAVVEEQVLLALLVLG